MSTGASVKRTMDVLEEEGLNTCMSPDSVASETKCGDSASTRHH